MILLHQIIQIMAEFLNYKKEDEDQQKSKLQKKNSDCKEGEEELEFGGPRGALCTMIIMPTLVYFLNAACNQKSCTLLAWPIFPENWSSLINFQSFLAYIGWLLFQASLHIIIPGNVVPGVKLPNGQKLVYKCNGLTCLIVTSMVIFFCIWRGWGISFVIDNYFALMTSAALTSFFITSWLYLKSQLVDKHFLNPIGDTGNVIYDCYVGRELNPRLGNFDLKFFTELRPGLMAWILLDFVYLAHSWKTSEVFNYPLLVMSLFHLTYAGDALFFEESVTTTLDITTEGFGFMLVFGNLTFVPFVFSLSARFLMYHPQVWSNLDLVILIILHCFGYWIFRASNNEKDLFRRHPYHPSLARLQTISAQCGKKLLTTGWWGMCRHPNYFGDILMAMAWALLCGSRHAIPSFYFLYLTGTLLHRCGRDDKICQKKYGECWLTYRSIVRYKLIPAVY